MAVNTYTPLLHEVLKKVHNAKTKDKKVSILRENDSEALRMVIKGSFDPNIEWVLPEGDVPYKKNEAARWYGTYHVVPRSKKNYGTSSKAVTVRHHNGRRKQMFVQMLEGCLWRSRSGVAAKDKKLHQVYKGLSAAVVKEAFGWNDQITKTS